jgi:hypothetical protein
VSNAGGDSYEGMAMEGGFMISRENGIVFGDMVFRKPGSVG